jgi:hypothetical protein
MDRHLTASSEYSDGIAALKLRGPEVKILTLMVAQEEEWQLCL